MVVLTSDAHFTNALKPFRDLWSNVFHIKALLFIFVAHVTCIESHKVLIFSQNIPIKLCDLKLCFLRNEMTVPYNHVYLL